MAKKRKIVTHSSPTIVEVEKFVDDPEEMEEEVEYVEEVEYEEEGEGSEEEEDSEEEGDNVPIPSVLASFSKEALITLLSDAAENHPDVESRVREVAEADPAQRKIFVHGLKWDTTTETLLKEFQKFGEIEDCRVVGDKALGKSKGYGFILYRSIRGAHEALKEPKKTIDGRMTSCQLASHGSMPQQKLKDTQPVVYELEQTQRKIYVSNVGEELDPKRLTAFFLRYGEIEEGPLGLDKETGKPKGFCLFVYKTVEGAKRALAEPHKKFEGATLHCQKAIDGPKSQKKQMIESLKTSKRATQNQHFANNLAPGFVAPVAVPAAVQGNLMSPLVHQHQQPGLSMDPAALGQALTTLIAAQGSGLNLLGMLGAVTPGTRMVSNPAVVPALGNQLMHGGYGNQAAGMFSQTDSGVHGGQASYLNHLKRRGDAGRGQRGGRP